MFEPAASAEHRRGALKESWDYTWPMLVGHLVSTCALILAHHRYITVPQVVPELQSPAKALALFGSVFVLDV
eukprot:scaffold3187_cov361-Prasinococcus_capsulatus_cf.AAC.12